MIAPDITVGKGEESVRQLKATAPATAAASLAALSQTVKLELFDIVTLGFPVVL